jgi:uncharacterized protein (DUF433 family)
MAATGNIDFKRTPSLGEGIYFADDVAAILGLKYHKVHHLMNTFWNCNTFGGNRNKAINFFGLIEFYTYYHLRENGFSAQHIKSFHRQLAKTLQTEYPFASIRVADRDKTSSSSKIWYEYLGEIMRDDRVAQPSISSFIKPFINHIEYGEDLIAKRFFPLGKSKHVVVDPNHQFGQPVINGTNLQTQTVFSLFIAGESKVNICRLYDINEKDVDEAIQFHESKAA